MNEDRLAPLGKPRPGDEFERLFSVVRDTVLVNLATELSSSSLFTQGYKDPKFKTPGFPSQSQVFKIYGIRLTPHILFDLTDVETQGAKMATFLELSRLQLTKEGNVVFNEYLSSFANFDIIPSLPVAVDKSYLGVRSKFTNYFKFPEPITIPKSSTFEFQFTPAPGLTSAAGSTGGVADMVLPDSGLTNETGYAIYFDLITTKTKERG